MELCCCYTSAVRNWASFSTSNPTTNTGYQLYNSKGQYVFMSSGNHDEIAGKLRYMLCADVTNQASTDTTTPTPAATAEQKLQDATTNAVRKNKEKCYKGDLVCEKDKLGYEAISTLHAQMDDDNNGDIDLEESAEFLREELQYSKSHLSDHRSKTFHMNDTHITVDDLWQIWKNSEVHNWTVVQTVEWLIYDVELSQYVETFKNNAVDGSTLPRLAVNNLNFVSSILGIKNLVHKQKLALKATDVVLFGAPKYRHNYYKDVALVTAITIAAGGCWFAYRQNKQLEKNMAKTMQDMDSLAKSEQALQALQEKLEREEREKHEHIMYKEELEAKIRREVSEARLEAQQLKLTKEQTETELSRMKETQYELERTREALRMLQKELDVRSSLTPSLELQRWLQITYELELQTYNDKKALAEQQLFNAKESIERLRRKKQALFGSLRMAHSGFIDETETIIITAKRALEEVKHDLAERQYRWQQIESMCTFSVISNPGLRALIQSTGHADLYRLCHGGKLLDAPTAELDELDDISPAYSAVINALQSQSNGCTTLSKMNSPKDTACQSVTSDHRDSPTTPKLKSLDSHSSLGATSTRRNSPSILSDSLSRICAPLSKRRESPTKILPRPLNQRRDSLPKLLDLHSKRRNSPLFDCETSPRRNSLSSLSINGPSDQKSMHSTSSMLATLSDNTNSARGQKNAAASSARSSKHLHHSSHEDDRQSQYSQRSSWDQQTNDIPTDSSRAYHRPEATLNNGLPDDSPNNSSGSEHAAQQPSFSLYPDEAELSSNSSSEGNSHIPSNSNRPPLTRNPAVRRTPDSTAASRSIYSDSGVQPRTRVLQRPEPVRPRTSTNESLARYKRHRLAEQHNQINNHKLSPKVRRSQTSSADLGTRSKTPSPCRTEDGRPRTPVTADVLITDCTDFKVINPPSGDPISTSVESDNLVSSESAPVMLESDRSDSKESISSTKKRRKLPTVFKVFKSKPKSS